MTVWCATIAKWEEPYIREWIDWNKSIGIQHILIADNNDDERLMPVIQDYVDDGYVEVIDYRNKKSPQMEWLNHALKIAKENEIEWLALVDVDEFIITDSLARLLDGHTSTISLPWLIYDDNDQLYYEDRPVMERFTRTISWARSGMTPCKSIWHVPTTDEIDSNHRPKKYKARLVPEDYNGSYVAHYMFKSTEEYATKARRGRVLRPNPPRYTKENYFRFNNCTKEKEQVFNDTIRYEKEQIIRRRVRNN